MVGFSAEMTTLSDGRLVWLRQGIALRGISLKLRPRPAPSTSETLAQNTSKTPKVGKDFFNKC